MSAPENKPENWILKYHRTWRGVPSYFLPQSASCQSQLLPGLSVVKGPGKAATELVNNPSPPHSLCLEGSEDISTSFPWVDTSLVPSPCALSPSLGPPSMSKGQKTHAVLRGSSSLDPTMKVAFYRSRVTSYSYPPTSRPWNGQYSSGHLQSSTHSQMMSPSRYFISHSLFVRTLHCRGL